jgi:hypothetical protein
VVDTVALGLLWRVCGGRSGTGAALEGFMVDTVALRWHFRRLHLFHDPTSATGTSPEAAFVCMSGPLHFSRDTKWTAI